MIKVKFEDTPVIRMSDMATGSFAIIKEGPDNIDALIYRVVDLTDRYQFQFIESCIHTTKEYADQYKVIPVDLEIVARPRIK